MISQLLVFLKRTILSPRVFTLLLVAFGLMLGPVGIGRASSYITVTLTEDNKTANDGFCSLREAIIAANSDKQSGGKPGECVAGSGADTIIIPAGHYTLSRTDNGKEDAAATGDLDITEDLTIIGAGADVTVIDGNGITDRIFHVLSGPVTISGVTVQDGNVRGDGGGIYNAAHLTLTDSVLTQNAADGVGGALYNAATGTL
ncbi:MAG: CSLREA domain-containing protein, partial [Anaerolineae bacterium]